MLTCSGFLFFGTGVVIAPAAITRLLLPGRTPLRGDQAAAGSESFQKTESPRYRKNKEFLFAGVLFACVPPHPISLSPRQEIVCSDFPVT
jgi:hypothetical protein